ncbi:MAG: putative glycoside hydrolase [Oscillospiraceae bacterium]|nr:putative glycoside hydrolase [Oscillospiraceae bacterium]
MQKKNGTGNNRGNNRNTSYYKSRINKKSKDNSPNSFFDKSKKRQINSYIRAITVVLIFMVGVTIFIFIGIFLKNSVVGDDNNTTQTDASENAVIPPTQIWTSEDASTNPSGISAAAKSMPLAADNIPDIYGRFNGVYLDIQKLDSLDSLQNFIDRIKSEGINAVNIDIKKDSGIIPFHINGQFDTVVGSENEISLNIQDIIAMLHNNGLYISGNIACFKDDLAATTFANYPLKEAATGMHWTDGSGSAWLNIYSDGARKYIKDLVSESIKLGFDEIILSYFYLPNVQNPAALEYDDNGVSKTDIVRNFIMDIRSTIDDIAPKVKLGLNIQVNDFLYMPNDTMGVNPDDLITRCNFFTTSFAPSDFPSGALNISNPASSPYDTVKALCDHFKDLINSVGFRPMIQASSDDVITSQKQALREAGISVWELVNTDNIY